MLSGSENKNTNACHLLNTFKHNIWVVTNLFQLTLPIFEQKKTKDWTICIPKKMHINIISFLLKVHVIFNRQLHFRVEPRVTYLKMQFERQNYLLIAYSFITLAYTKRTFSFLWIFEPQKMLSSCYFLKNLTLRAYKKRVLLIFYISSYKTHKNVFFEITVLIVHTILRNSQSLPLRFAFIE